MLKYLETHRTKFALAAIVLAVSSIVLTVVFIPDWDILVPCVFLSVVVVISAAILWFRGVPGMLAFLVYCAILSTAIAIGTGLRLLLPLPETMDPQIITGATVCLVVFFLMRVPLPRMAKEKAKAHLYPAEDAGEATDTEDKNTYEHLITIKGQNTVNARPYTLSNLPPLQRKIRTIISLTILIAGTLAIFIGASLEDSSGTLPLIEALKTPSFWLCVGGVFAGSFGAFLLVLGYIRTIISHAILAVLAVLGVVLGYRLQDIAKESVALFVILLVLIFVLIALVIVGIRQYVKTKGAHVHFSTYEENNQFTGFDFAAKDMAPIAEYNKAISCSLRFDSPGSEHKINNLIVWLTASSNFRRYIFAGYQIKPVGTQSFVFTFYIYSFHDCTEFFRKKLAGSEGHDIKINCKTDPEWSVFQNKLIPDTYTLYTIYNRNLSDVLERDGYDFSKPLPLVYTLFFEEEADALSCVACAKENGYAFARRHSEAEFEDEDMEFEEDGLFDEVFSHLVYVQNFCSAGLAQLNLQTRKILDFAEQLKGELRDFDVGEMEVPEDKEI